jgi:hypothetical protein
MGSPQNSGNKASWAELDVDTIQQREGRWVLADLEGKGRRIRTVAIPIWVKLGINAWMIAAGIEDESEKSMPEPVPQKATSRHFML